MPFGAAWETRARQIVGDRLVSDPLILSRYSTDEYFRKDLARPPAAVLRPSSEEEVAALVRLCHETRVPLTVRGAGTGLAGGCVPAEGGVVLSMELLDKVVERDAANLSITVQAGLPLRRLWAEAEGMGLYFPPHPGDGRAFAGGAVATNAGGARAVKYGTVRRFVLGLQVVLASGEIVELGGRYVKSSTGYHLADLIIGSEGTLGVITRVTFALLPGVGSVRTLVAPFTGVEEAISAVPGMLARGILPAAVEFVEHDAMRASERLLNAAWPSRQGEASLMVIVDGRDEEDTGAQARAIEEALMAGGSLPIIQVTDRGRQDQALSLRSNLYEAIKQATEELYDVSVPRSQIAGHVGAVHAIARDIGAPLPTFGHAADGNVHTHFLRTTLVDGIMGADIPGWQEKRERATAAIFADVARRGGVISGEHGIGIAKKAWLPRTVDPTLLAVMRSVKKALDPDGILNPGKIFET